MAGNGDGADLRAVLTRSSIRRRSKRRRYRSILWSVTGGVNNKRRGPPRRSDSIIDPSAQQAAPLQIHFVVRHRWGEHQNGADLRAVSV